MVANRMIVLWMSGLTWEMLGQVSRVEELRSQGAALTYLEPVPIAGRKSQKWQMLSGQNPGRYGYFDSYGIDRYKAQPAIEPTVETFHELITSAGGLTMQVNLTLAEIATYLHTSTPSVDCLIIHTHVNRSSYQITQAIDAACTWTGPEGTCILLSDYHASAVQRFVNFNDGLRAVGILESPTGGTIRWEETLAYHVGHGQIWINIEGREPRGIVTLGDEYEQICQALITSLPAKLLDPKTGETVIERIYRREELYRGDYFFRAPDLIAVLRPGYAPSPTSVELGFDGVPILPAPGNTYAFEGLYPETVAGLVIASGSPFAPNQTVHQAPLTAIAPTILYALGLGIPRSMDTGIIMDLFTPAFRETFPVHWIDRGTDLSEEDEAEIMERLKSLGYVG